MKPYLLCLALTALTACATSDAPPQAAPTTLSEEAFQALRMPILKSQDAHRYPTQLRGDQQLTALMQRPDLSTDQLAQLYYDRGFSRGLFVNNYPMALPQCAVLDFREMERLSPNHPNIEKMKDNRGYQFARFKFFPNAPAECKAGAEAYAAELGDCMGARDANGACIVKYNF